MRIAITHTRVKPSLSFTNIAADLVVATAGGVGVLAILAVVLLLKGVGLEAVRLASVPLDVLMEQVWHITVFRTAAVAVLACIPTYPFARYSWSLLLAKTGSPGVSYFMPLRTYAALQVAKFLFLFALAVPAATLLLVGFTIEKLRSTLFVRS